MKIEYYRKNVYGNENLYIKDQKTAVAVGELTGKVTIDARDIKCLEFLGHTFTEVLPPREIEICHICFKGTDPGVQPCNTCNS